VLSRENVAHQRFDYSVRVYDAKTQLAEGRAQELLGNLPEAIQVRRYRADMIFCPALANKEKLFDSLPPKSAGNYPPSWPLAMK
jgi:hypothetical protein